MTRARDMANIAAGSFDIPSGSLTNAVPADGSITTAKLAANAVTNAKLATNAITSDLMPSGSIIGGHSIVNGTRTNVQGTGVRSYTWGTFNKSRSDTKIMYSGLLLVHDDVNNDSDATGLYIQFSGTGMTTIKQRHMSRIDVTGTNYKERFLAVSGELTQAEIPINGTITVTWGTDTTGSYIAHFWNPNTTDDNRYNGQRESVLNIWEVK